MICTLPTALASPLKGSVRVNWLPNGTEAAEVYQDTKWLSTGTLNWAVWRFAPVAGTKVTDAEDTWRVVAYPVTTICKPCADLTRVTELITGGPGAMRSTRVGGGVGVTSTPFENSRVTIVIVPATVPVCRPRGSGLNNAFVAPWAIVKVAVRCPLENTTPGSSEPASGVNVSIDVPVSGTGEGAERLIPTFGWLPGLGLSVTPVTVSEGRTGAWIVTENAAVIFCAGLLESVARIENENEPAADGRPERLPLASSETPFGSDPLATENV